MKDHAVIVLRNGSKILFIQRSATKKSLPNVWAFPSGTMEEGETPEMTVLREAREELGCDVLIEKKLATVELPELDSRLHFIVCVQVADAPLTCDEREIQAMQWMTMEEFFEKYTDDQIGHGLQYLRKHPKIWKETQVNCN